jgi:hypothetical protein
VIDFPLQESFSRFNIITVSSKVYQLETYSLSDKTIWIDNLSSKFQKLKEESKSNDEYDEIGKIKYKSFLKKKGEKGIEKSWNQRLFVIEDMKLNYYIQETGSLKGSININEITDIIKDPSNDDTKLFLFNILTNSKVYYLEALNIEDYTNWFNAINSLVKNNQEIIKNIKKNSTIKRESKRRNIFIKSPNQIISSNLNKKGKEGII